MPLHASRVIGPMGMTLTVGTGVAGKSLQEPRQGGSDLSQEYPPFRAFPQLFSCILGFPVRYKSLSGGLCMEYLQLWKDMCMDGCKGEM